MQRPQGGARPRAWRLRLALGLVLVVQAAEATLPTVASACAGGDLLSLMNCERDAVGLDPLGRRADLDGFAQAWSKQMEAAGAISHNDAYFASRSRIGARSLGENVGVGGSVGDVHERLMASSAHRANILSTRFNLVGIGVAGSPGETYVTEAFAEVPSAAPTTTRPATPTLPPVTATARPITTTSGATTTVRGTSPPATASATASTQSTPQESPNQPGSWPDPPDGRVLGPAPRGSALPEALAGLSLIVVTALLARRASRCGRSRPGGSARSSSTRR